MSSNIASAPLTSFYWVRLWKVSKICHSKLSMKLFRRGWVPYSESALSPFVFPDSIGLFADLRTVSDVTDFKNRLKIRLLNCLFTFRRCLCEFTSYLIFIFYYSPMCFSFLSYTFIVLECGPMPNVMAALPNVGGALCSTSHTLADAHY